MIIIIIIYIYVHIVYPSGFSAESNLAEVFADVAGDPVRPWGDLWINFRHYRGHLVVLSYRNISDSMGFDGVYIHIYWDLVGFSGIKSCYFSSLKKPELIPLVNTCKRKHYLLSATPTKKRKSSVPWVTVCQRFKLVNDSPTRFGKSQKWRFRSLGTSYFLWLGYFSRSHGADSRRAYV